MPSSSNNAEGRREMIDDKAREGKPTTDDDREASFDDSCQRSLADSHHATSHENVRCDA